MGYKCSVVGCRTGYAGGEKQSTFFFPKDLYLKDKWEMFVNRKDWNPSKYSIICAKHFDPKYIKEGKKSKLIWELQPIPTIHDNPDMCVVPPLPRKAPKERNVFNDMSGMNLKPMTQLLTSNQFLRIFVQKILLF